MNGSNLWFDDIYVNNTAPSAPPGKNWVQNTDGFDTMDVQNVALTNFVYQGMFRNFISPVRLPLVFWLTGGVPG